MVSPLSNSSSSLWTTAVDSALSGRNEVVSSSVESASFEPRGNTAIAATIHAARTTHLPVRLVTKLDSVRTSAHLNECR